MEIPSLTTDRLLLRPFRHEDFDAYAAMNADPQVMQYIDEVQDRPAAFRSLAANIGHWHLRGYGPWAVEERATGRFIGRAGLLRWEPWSEVEVGYALIPSAWGKGYATEVAACSLRYAHEVVKARGVVSRILAGNAASIRVAERLGARYAGEAQSPKGPPVRVYVYADPG
jgi:RimJ/RimL family protein N-acetyltransferase